MTRRSLLTLPLLALPLPATLPAFPEGDGPLIDVDDLIQIGIDHDGDTVLATGENGWSWIHCPLLETACFDVQVVVNGQAELSRAEVVAQVKRLLAVLKNPAAQIVDRSADPYPCAVIELQPGSARVRNHCWWR